MHFFGVCYNPRYFNRSFHENGDYNIFIVEKLGFTGILVLIGSFHIYFEFLAALLAIDAFFKFYISFISSIRQHDITVFKENVLKEFLPIFLRIILLLAFAAILEVFWSTWWVYILTDHYISWYEFYFGAYSVLLI